MPLSEPEAPKVKRRKQESLLQFYTPSKKTSKETGLWSIDSWNGTGTSLFSPLAKFDELDKPEIEFTAPYCKRKEKFNKFTRSYEIEFGGHRPQVKLLIWSKSRPPYIMPSQHLMAIIYLLQHLITA